MLMLNTGSQSAESVIATQELKDMRDAKESASGTRKKSFITPARGAIHAGIVRTGARHELTVIIDGKSLCGLRWYLQLRLPESLYVRGSNKQFPNRFVLGHS